MSVIDVLTKARALIAKPECHTSGAFARDRDGEPVHVDNAVCWCSLGAVMAVLPNRFDQEPIHVALARQIDPIVSSWPAADIVAFNDTNPHAAVIGMFDDAIIYEQLMEGV